MPATLSLALALVAGLSLLAVGAAATTMGDGLMSGDHWSMMSSEDHRTMMDEHDHESMSAKECEEGTEAHLAHMEGGDHCD